jgi:hypothetical protein
MDTKMLNQIKKVVGLMHKLANFIFFWLAFNVSQGFYLNLVQG